MISNVPIKINCVVSYNEKVVLSFLKSILFSVEVACPDPGTPENGRRQIESLQGGRTVQYSCFDGYRLVGESKRTCHSGKWTGSLPSCNGERLGVATIIGLWAWVLFAQAGAIINRMCTCLWTNCVIKSVVHLFISPVHTTSSVFDLFAYGLMETNHFILD